MGEEVAELCHKKYEELGKSGKPGRGEWTTLAGVVVENGEEVWVASLATGTKCLGRTSLKPDGLLLSDSHAEVLARRAFLNYLYDQIEECLRSGSSKILSHHLDGKCHLRPSVKFHFYCSHVPCGDASIIDMTENEVLKEKRDNDVGPLVCMNKTDLSCEAEDEKISTRSFPENSQIHPSLDTMDHPLAKKVKLELIEEVSKNEPKSFTSESCLDKNSALSTEGEHIGEHSCIKPKCGNYTSPDCKEDKVSSCSQESATLSSLASKDLVEELVWDIKSDESKEIKVIGNNPECMVVGVKRPFIPEVENDSIGVTADCTAKAPPGPVQGSDILKMDRSLDSENLAKTIKRTKRGTSALPLKTRGSVEVISEDLAKEITEIEGTSAVPLQEGCAEVVDVHRTGGKCVGSVRDPGLPGRLYHVLGAVRTKPGRGDPTLSVSCSDKLTRWLHLGLQGGLVSMLLGRVWLSSLTVGGGGQYSESALRRALGRAGPIPLALHRATQPFPHSRYRPVALRPSPASLVWSYNRLTEVAVEGRKFGVTKKSRNVQLSISRKELFKRFLPLVGADFSGLSYFEAKERAIEYRQDSRDFKCQMRAWTVKPPMDFRIE